MYLLGLTHPHLPGFVFFPRKPCPPPSWASLCGRWDSARYGFQVLDELPCSASPRAMPDLLQMSAALTRTLVHNFTGSSGPRQKWPPTHGQRTHEYMPLPAAFPF